MICPICQMPMREIPVDIFYTRWQCQHCGEESAFMLREDRPKVRIKNNRIEIGRVNWRKE